MVMRLLIVVLAALLAGSMAQYSGISKALQKEMLVERLL